MFKEWIELIKEIYNETQNEKLITLLEKIDDYEKANDGVDWKQKYEENDKAWKEKYVSRFYSSDETEDEDEKRYTFEELFEEVKE